MTHSAERPRPPFVIGIDFGTESARALLVAAATGCEVATAVALYRSGVIDRALPVEGAAVLLAPDWALQDPEDYLRALQTVVPEVLRAAGAAPADVVGLGVAFTSCTMLPVAADGTPLCALPAYRRQPHAWVKLWKHHAAQPEADAINRTAHARGEAWLARYGGSVSSEWFFPKVLQMLDEAPEIYQAAGCLLEAADWIVWQLTGVPHMGSSTAGYKALWSKQEGFPSPDFFGALHPGLAHVVEEKLPRQVRLIGERAGGLTPQAAAWTGLREGTAVAVGLIDAHASVPAATVTEPGRMVMIMGTSICQMVLGRRLHRVEGIAGMVEDGIVPGLVGYEAGQPSLGDTLAWCSRTLVAPSVAGENAYQRLEQAAAMLQPGASGLLALDWWNGNRSLLDDSALSGLLLGLTLATTPAEVYRAAMEASAFGTRVIIEAFEVGGVPVAELVACGGLAERSPLLLQVYADVTSREIRVAAAGQTSAFGAAMHGAVAAGSEAGGYNTIVDAAARMARLKAQVYRPISAHQAIYDRLYTEYKRLYDHFGRGANEVMKSLRQLRAATRSAGAASGRPS